MLTFFLVSAPRDLPAFDDLTERIGLLCKIQRARFIAMRARRRGGAETLRSPSDSDESKRQSSSTQNEIKARGSKGEMGEISSVTNKLHEGHVRPRGTVDALGPPSQEHPPVVFPFSLLDKISLLHDTFST